MPENTPRFVELLLEFWNTGNTSLVGQVYTDDSQRFDPNGPEPLRGPDQVGKYVLETRAAFPDFRIEVVQLITDGDSVVLCWRCTGTHKGDFQGIPPTGKTVIVEGVSVGLVKDGRVSQERVFFDRLNLLQQLGVAPGQGFPQPPARP